jgi:hypothetical protein
MDNIYLNAAQIKEVGQESMNMGIKMAIDTYFPLYNASFKELVILSGIFLIICLPSFKFWKKIKITSQK